MSRSLAFPDAIVASDAMPPLWTDTAGMDLAAWPLPAQVVTHPRTAGTFGRALRLWRIEGVALSEAVRRATLLPATVLEGTVPAVRRKGRVQAGMDADLVVFDEARVTDRATYDASTRPSAGIALCVRDFRRDRPVLLTLRAGTRPPGGRLTSLGQ